MKHDNVIKIEKPETITTDLLTDILKEGSLSGKQYVYFWADGLYCNVRLEEKECLLVIIGVPESGRKELVALEDGFRESELS